MDHFGVPGRAGVGLRFGKDISRASMLGFGRVNAIVTLGCWLVPVPGWVKIIADCFTFDFMFKDLGRYACGALAMFPSRQHVMPGISRR